ncbi:MAG: hypothetical protein V2A56_12025 [bacterium]
MLLNGMVWYVGLADDPAHLTRIFPTLPSFSVGHQFENRQAALQWLQRMQECGYQTLPISDNGWRFGLLAAFPEDIRPLPLTADQGVFQTE